jgi:NAD(P)-dependent dehydrogenase (short-subunit alcohol dehydrogenase family)
MLDVGEELRRLGTDPICVIGDIIDPDHRTTLIDSAERLGSLDLIVNNASTLGPSPLPRLDAYPLEELRRVYEVNVIAALALLQGALPLLRRSGGTAVSLSSDAAVEGYEGWGGYGSSKAALDQLHQVLTVEEPRLRIYQFDPGDMRTTMHQAAFPGEDISDRPEPESVVPLFRRLLESGAPSGRYGASEWGCQP